jgi:TfoX/Sxy family transcriptional regulator of competence genes
MQVMLEPSMRKPVRATAQTAAQRDALADLLRAALPAKGVSERKMFGGTGFMLNGNMVAGTFRDGLLVRVGKEQHRAALARPGAGPMVMRGKPIEGYILVDGEGLRASAVEDWVQLALTHVRTLPPKSPKPKTARSSGGRK